MPPRSITDHRAAWPLVGRSEELELVTAALGASGTSFVIAGPAGVGKTRLASELLAAASEGGLATATVRATRSTATIPFGAFAAWVGDHGSGTTDAGGSEGLDRLRVVHEVTRSLLRGAERAVVSVDDAHLLDDGSAALILHLVSDPRIAVVATVRSHAPCPDAVTALWKDELAERIDLQALSATESADLAAAVLGGPLEETARDRVWDLTGGSPLFLREVLRAATSQGVLRRAEDVWVWNGSLRGSDRLDDLIGGRLSTLDDSATRLCELLAAAEPLPVPLIDVLGHGGDVRSAEQLGCVAVDDPQGGAGSATSVRLAHPLFGEVLRASSTSTRHRELLGSLVDAARSIGWQQQHPLRVAEWALDADATLDLEDALLATRRALALSDWRLAERLSVAAGDDLHAVLLRAISASPQVRWDAALDRVAAEALAALPDDVDAQTRGEAARVHSWRLIWGQGDALDVDRAVAAADRLPHTVRAEALAHCSLQAALRARPEHAVGMATAALERCSGVGAGRAGALVDGDPGELACLEQLDDVAVEALAAAAFAAALQGRTRAALAIAEATLGRVGEIIARDPVPGNPAAALPVAYCLALVLDGRIGEAVAVARLIHDAGAGGPRSAAGLAAALLGRMELFAGRVDRADELSRSSLSICRATGQLPASHWPAGTAALTAAQLDRPDDGETILRTVHQGCEAGPLYGYEQQIARAWLLATRCELSAARSHAVTTARRAADDGLHAVAFLAWLDAARLGERSSTVATAMAESPVEGEFARSARAFVTALDRADAVELAACSVSLESCGADLLAAEASAAAGVAFDAAGLAGSAVSAFGRARVLAAACGEPTTPMLRVLDGDPALSSLTDREREVVELAATGLGNREIADRLFVSVRTVTTHLYRSYAKLGVNDREMLAPLLSSRRGNRSTTE